MTRIHRINRLIAAIPNLTDYRLQLIDKIVGVFALPKEYRRLDSSTLITDNILEDFGDILHIHHCFSREPFSKDKFEHALERVIRASGTETTLSPRGHKGYDIQIGGENFSLKTEAARAIRIETVHISKFMELGGGKWGSDPADLIGLRKQFLDALTGIQRILILRALRKGTPDYFYELVEIPKPLLGKAALGRLEMMTHSTQNPKPGYCFVEDAGQTSFSLYFDGGGERKLQIKGLWKSLCTVHATWKFDPPIDTP